MNARRPSTLAPWRATTRSSKPPRRSISWRSAARKYTSVSGRSWTVSPTPRSGRSTRRGLTNTIRAPRARAERNSPITLLIDQKLPCEARGFSPMIRHRSVCSTSGIGCTVVVPNTACEAANLLAQSWVPELNVRRVPSVPISVAEAVVPSALNAVGLPMYTETASGPCSAMIASRRRAMSASASSHDAVVHSPSAARRSEASNRSGSSWTSSAAIPLWQANPLVTGCSWSARKAVTRPSATVATNPHDGSQIRQKVLTSDVLLAPGDVLLAPGDSPRTDDVLLVSGDSPRTDDVLLVSGDSPRTDDVL